MSGSVIILGLGFTTRRLAGKLLSDGTAVCALVRNARPFADLAALGLDIRELSAGTVPAGGTLIHTIPPLPEPEKTSIHNLIRRISPRRILYISSTGVYGAQTNVDELTVAAPNDEKGLARLDEEQWIAGAAGESSLILRSAAIYGPGRGVHARLREGTLPRGAGVVSRIHVEDLVTHLEAGINSDVSGAWPVADEYPASSDEVIAWCAEFMKIPLPQNSGLVFPVNGRRVDGTKIRGALDIRLKYLSYRSGIPASLAEGNQ